ncbi:NAD(P)-binding domain-containing protein [Streptomyces marincola]|uniref:Pyrroline-5-carboxylate reductase catalytic N-terminal domain-containing protein n=1 Tax=Streptomyces marincola TaxID=2878388 RepID=A0A1W7CYQ8_9ACTN|nr:NAD(P)-binding domain-containing protein [Streptomyces marincola]ARQ69938.1 hypothetical protein CAG99_14690 [Streptomyces marincola]
MRIGCVGAGQVGGALARFFAGLGHEVLVANSRDQDRLAVPVPGDDAEARALVFGPVRAVGFDPVAAGGLAAGGGGHERGRRVCATGSPAPDLAALPRTGA